MSNILYKSENGKQFWCSEGQAKVLDILKQTNKGGICTVHGYIPESGWEIPPKIDLQIITRISVSSLYKRKIAELEAITFNDIKPFLNESKLSKIEESEQYKLFSERKQKLIDSMKKTLSGNRNDSYRMSHDYNYITVTQGIKVNLEGDKVNGIKNLKLIDGFPIAKSIMLICLEISRKEIIPGKRKESNSSNEVIMSNIIESQLNSKSVGIKTLSLKPTNFDSISICKQHISKEDLFSICKDKNKVDTIIEATNVK
jgi:hypothetical protein